MKNLHARRPVIDPVRRTDPRVRVEKRIQTRGDIVYEGEYATNTARGRYVGIDGRLDISPLLSCEDLARYHRARTPTRAAMELILGLFMEQPCNIETKSEAMLLQVLFQLANAEQRAFITANKDMFLGIFGIASFSTIIGLVSMIKRRNGDVQWQHRAAWVRNVARTVVDTGLTFDLATATDTTITNRHMMVLHRRMLRESWARNATMAITFTDNANEIRLHPRGPRTAPPIRVVKYNPRTGRTTTPLTSPEIENIGFP
jgi:hypothetical protein